MTRLIVTLLVVLACVAAYLAIGFGYAAPLFVGRGMRVHVRDYPALTSPALLEAERQELAAASVLRALAWPAWLAWAALTDSIARRAPRTGLELRREAGDEAELPCPARRLRVVREGEAR